MLIGKPERPAFEPPESSRMDLAEAGNQMAVDRLLLVLQQAVHESTQRLSEAERGEDGSLA